MQPDIEWFLDRLRAEVPQRLHSRETDDGGYPQWHGSFTAWMLDGEEVRDEQDICYHPTLIGKGHCETCDDTGLRIRTRQLYRNPMKRAVRKIGQQPVPKGRPKLDVVLWSLARHDGNVEMAIEALRLESAYMWNVRKARGWIDHALWELRAVYREDAPARIIKSEQQQIAEAAA